MTNRNFREVLDLLDQKGDLVRISKEVDPKFEMPALMKQLEEEGKAFIFENVKGAKHPSVGGIFTSMDRYGLIFNPDASEKYSFDDAGGKVLSGVANPIENIVLDKGPISEEIYIDDAINLMDFPVATFFELDSGPFITSAVGIFKKPNGVINVGFYRCMIVDQKHLLINASGLSDLRKSYDWHRENNKEMSVAMVIGAPPPLLMAAASKCPDDVSELEVAGGMIGKGIETILSPDSGLPIPIESEIVIEAKVDLNNMIENTLGEFGNQYGTEDAPMCKVTSIMKRKDAMFYNVMAGRAKEHNNLGYLTIYGLSKGVCAKIKESFSFVKDVAIHFDTKIGPLMHVVIAIKKSSDDQPAEIINKAFNLSLGFFNLSWMAKRVIIVDDDIDINNMDDVEWATWTRMGRAEKMHLFSDFITWEIDRAALPDKTSLRVGIDATKDMDYFDDLVKPIVPGIDQINLKDYL